MLKLPISTILFSLLSLVLSKTYQTLDGNAPIVIAHRGASGLRPDHTLSAYILAIEQGADFIEPDLLMTKDGVLICRHEPMLSLSTNVSKFPEFADRRKWKVVSGLSHHDWFVDDFTVEELKRLGAKQPSAERSRKYDYQDTISTFDEVIELVKNKSAELGRTIGIYPELKHPSFHIHANLPLTDKLLETLDREGWNHNSSAVYVQSMEVATLQYVRSKSTVKLVQLFLGSGCDKTGKMLMYSPNAQPYDFILAKDHRTFRDLTTNEGLDFIKTYADGIGVWTPYVIPYTFQDLNLDNRPDDLNGDGWIDSRDYIRLPTSDLVDRAHERGLLVHVWKLRDEHSSLLSDYAGNPLMEYADVYDAGVDGVFSDYTLTAVIARAAL